MQRKREPPSAATTSAYTATTATAATSAVTPPPLYSQVAPYTKFVVTQSTGHAAPPRATTAPAEGHATRAPEKAAPVSLYTAAQSSGDCVEKFNLWHSNRALFTQLYGADATERGDVATEVGHECCDERTGRAQSNVYSTERNDKAEGTFSLSLSLSLGPMY